MKNKYIITILTLFIFAALEMPASASTESGLAADDLLVNNGVDFVPGYGIIAYTISLTASPNNIPADGISTSTITAQLMDQNGNNVAISGVIIDLKTTGGTLSDESPSTNSEGTATVTLKSSTKSGVANILAKSDSVLVPGHAQVDFTKINTPKNTQGNNFLQLIMGLFS
jgi:hypothetical protein